MGDSNRYWLSILKELWFHFFPIKVFDVRVNNILAVKLLDIYDRVGKAVAHDEYIPFTITKGQILVENQMTRFTGNLHVEFVKVGKCARQNVTIITIIIDSELAT